MQLLLVEVANKTWNLVRVLSSQFIFTVNYASSIDEHCHCYSLAFSVKGWIAAKD